MLNARLRRAFAVLVFPAFCGVLAGCERDGSGERTPEAARAGTDTAALRRAAATDVRVVLQMTGLLLVVPSRQAGQPVHILMPKPRGLPAHATRLGFGIAGGSTYVTELCDTTHPGAIEAEICYVDLDRWKLEPFGKDGRNLTPTLAELPRGLVNLTRTSGNVDRVDLSKIDTLLRAHVVLLSGRPDGQPCRLTSWTYRHVGSSGQTVSFHREPLINVLDWEIKHPAGNIELRFTLRDTTKDSTVTALLPPPNSSGKIEILLVHVPVPELAELPPNTASRPGQPPGSAIHVDVLYDLLRIPVGSPRRPVPTSPGQAPSACLVDITTRSKIQREKAGIRTYACMPAAAEIAP